MTIEEKKNRQKLYNEISGKVQNFITKYEEGFIEPEIEMLLNDYPDINMDKFNDALNGTTCMMIENKLVTFPCDVEIALRCGIENRDITSAEFD